MPVRSPQIHFLVHGRYLPRSAWRSVPVRHLNADRATVTIRHVPPENLVFWMSNDHTERADERTSNLLASAPMALGGVVDQERTTFLDLAQWVPPDTRGPSS